MSSSAPHRPPRVVLGVTGGIAAYKAAEIVRGLTEAGAEVRVVMTPAATKFLGPLTLAVLSKNPVVADLWDPASGAVDHVDLARWADLLLVAPATADAIAKLARGLADDVLSTYALAHRTALALAPAMNTFMWTHEATRENLATLVARGADVIEPDAGDLACGDVGPGRLAPPARIVTRALAAARVGRDLEGRTIVVTAGPTREPIDPVRFVSNRSSGRMGYAIATAARKRGAAVVLVSGPVSLEPPAGIRVVRVERAAEMRDAVLRAAETADALVMAAAPADFVPAAPAPRKIKRAQGPPDLRLEPAPDILGAVRQARPDGLVVVAFAAETDDLLANARKKRVEKRADILVANDVGGPAAVFESSENEVVILSDGGEETVARASKTVVAGRILDRLAAVLAEASPKSAVTA